jgi:hypothetical protein
VEQRELIGASSMNICEQKRNFGARCSTVLDLNQKEWAPGPMASPALIQPPCRMHPEHRAVTMGLLIIALSCVAIPPWYARRACAGNLIPWQLWLGLTMGSGYRSNYLKLTSARRF